MDKRLVLVRWLDSQDHPDKWVAEADAEEFGNVDCLVSSVGYLVSETGKYYTLGADWDAVDKDYGRVTKVARGMVQSIIDLKEVGEA